jgi:hypothetical protein
MMNLQPGSFPMLALSFETTRKEILTFQEQEGGPWKIPIDVSPVIYFIPEPGKTDLTC